MSNLTLDTLGPLEAARLKWLMQARPGQLPPPGDWLIWLVLAGRGYGKTRVGAEDAADFATKWPNVRIGCVAPTLGSGKKVCFEGESGLLSILPRGTYQYNKAELYLKFDNGSRIDLFSADQPERLRGPQHHRLWCDEMAGWGVQMKNTWDMAMFGLRLPMPDGSPNQTVITTTPKPFQIFRDIVSRETTVMTKGSTFENEANLSRAMLEELRRQYEGTRLGQQELYADLLDDIEGALWSMELIELGRMREPEIDLDMFDRISVAIDPSISSTQEADETGLIVAGRTPYCPCGHASPEDPHMIVLRDASGQMSVAEWSDKALMLAEEFSADDFVAEVNQGGDMVEKVLESARERRKLRDAVRYCPVRATRGKRVRAEPIGMQYEKSRVHHWGVFPKLEDQMCTWTGLPGEASPDRVDALVWAGTHLLLRNGKRRGGLRG